MPQRLCSLASVQPACPASAAKGRLRNGRPGYPPPPVDAVRHAGRSVAPGCRRSPASVAVVATGGEPRRARRRRHGRRWRLPPGPVRCRRSRCIRRRRSGRAGCWPAIRRRRAPGRRGDSRGPGRVARWAPGRSRRPGVRRRSRGPDRLRAGARLPGAPRRGRRARSCRRGSYGRTGRRPATACRASAGGVRRRRPGFSPAPVRRRAAGAPRTGWRWRRWPAAAGRSQPPPGAGRPVAGRPWPTPAGRRRR